LTEKPYYILVPNRNNAWSGIFQWYNTNKEPMAALAEATALYSDETYWAWGIRIGIINNGILDFRCLYD